MMKELQFAAILCVTVGVLAASAQSPPQTSQPDPKACAPGERLERPGPRQQSPSDTTGQADSNPSERLGAHGLALLASINLINMSSSV